jgi:flavin reductase (DIM6/NTAB) family NADH-FMN oxidoreductase RutF
MDEQAKKTALRMIPYGLFVVSTKEGETVNAFAANWLTQASFAPPLVAMAAKAGQAGTNMLESGGIFCVNVLEAGQTELATKFFSLMERVGNKFGDIAFKLSATDARHSSRRSRTSNAGWSTRSSGATTPCSWLR